jgi:hypothetical protein
MARHHARLPVMVIWTQRTGDYWAYRPTLCSTQISRSAQEPNKARLLQRQAVGMRTATAEVSGPARGQRKPTGQNPPNLPRPLSPLRSWPILAFSSPGGPSARLGTTRALTDASLPTADVYQRGRADERRLMLHLRATEAGR